MRPTGAMPLRPFVLFTVALAVLPLAHSGAQEVSSSAVPDRVGQPLSPRPAGGLDLHHIVTGRGNAMLAVLPDGTTLLVDAGAAGDGIPHTDPRPDGTRRPGEWIAHYIHGVLPPDAPRRLDYAVVSHFHVDHAGGLADVDARLPIDTVIDRGWPAYDAPLPPPAVNAPESYRTWVAGVVRRGGRVQQAVPGTADQVTLRRGRPADAPFEVRVVAANGRVWTGQGTATTSRVPDLPPGTPAAQRLSENESSVALRLAYGPFDYFTGGDLTGIPDPGVPDWHDLETPIATAIGEVDVRQMNHHGSISPENAAFLAATRPRVVIIPAWSPTHPAPDALKRVMAPTAFPGPRDVFVTILREPTALTIGDRATQLASAHGHVVVRVAPGGRRYHVAVLDDTQADPVVRTVHGPYDSRP